MRPSKCSLAAASSPCVRSDKSSTQLRQLKLHAADGGAMARCHVSDEQHAFLYLLINEHRMKFAYNYKYMWTTGMNRCLFHALSR